MENSDMSEVSVKERLEKADAGYKEAVGKMLQVKRDPENPNKFSWVPESNINDPEVVRTGLREVLQWGLKVTKARAEQAMHKLHGASIERVLFDKLASPYDFAKDTAAYERAIEVVDGGRENVTSLENVMVTVLADMRRQLSEGHEDRYQKLLPKFRLFKMAFLGWGGIEIGKDENEVQRENRRFADESDLVTNLRQKIKDDVPRWKK